MYMCTYIYVCVYVYKVHVWVKFALWIIYSMTKNVNTHVAEFFWSVTKVYVDSENCVIQLHNKTQVNSTDKMNIQKSDGN